MSNSFDIEKMQWNIINNHFKTKKNYLVDHHLSSFNNFYFNQIYEIFKMYNPILFNKEIDEDTNEFKYKCKIYLGGRNGDKIYYGKPVIYDKQGNYEKQHYMYPNEARLRNMTYAITIHYDIDIDFKLLIDNNKGGKNMDKFDVLEFSETMTNIYLGRFPIMVGSNLCILNNLSSEARFNLGECRNDPGGYFIIDGKEKVIVSQESRRDNMLYVLEDINDNISHSAEIRSVSEDASKPTRTFSVFMERKYNNIVVNIPNVRKPIPLFIVMRALGVISDKEIIETCLLDMEKYDDYIDYFIPCVHDAGMIFDKMSAIKFISTFTKYKSIPSTIEILTNYLLPHIGEFNFTTKARYIGYMVKKLIMVYSKTEKPTNRDSYRYKRIEVSGKLIEQLFGEYYKLQIEHILKKMDTEYYFNISSYENTNFKDIILNNKELIFSEKIIERGFKKAFKGDWGSAAHTKRIGALQELSRLSFFSTLCQLRKTNLPISSQAAKIVGPRLLNSTQWGLLCPLHSPDGGNVGLHKHMSTFVHITRGESKKEIILVLKMIQEIKLIEECSNIYLANSTKIFINGGWYGNTKMPTKLVKILKTLKRNALINIYTSILFNIGQNEILISTDSGRPCRPLFYKKDDGSFSYESDLFSQHVKNNKLKWNNIIEGYYDKKEEQSTNIKMIMKNIEKLEKTSCVLEYLDTQESEYIIVDSKYSSDNITHKELHPSAILGFMANQIIFPENNPYPRNAFSCGQAKQAVSMYHSNFNNRMDKTSLVLNYGQVPLTKSRYLDYATKEQHPYGENAIVAIMCYSGYNVEDAIMVNEASLKRGLFNTTYYNVYETHEESIGIGDSKQNSRFMNIQKNNVYGLRTGFDYSHLDDEFGIIKEGTVVDEKTVIIGKAVEDPDNLGQYIDASVTPKKGQVGIVDKAFITIGEEGQRIAKVRIRGERIPEMGDKFCSRAGQKGTIGFVIPETDMPCTAEGIRPDIIVNPHAMPSRMTIGHLVECIFSKAGALYGNFGDCTAFVNKGPKHVEYGELLTDQGYHKSGNEILYNGMTGEQIESEIYLGPTYYLRLKHMPKDKINYRARGPRTMLTRQTVGGRANDGGLRIGEMDRDCIVAHGMSNFLKESMMERGDKFYMAVCNKTGCIAVYNENKNLFLSPYADGPLTFTQSLTGEHNIKQISKHGRDFSVVCVPYAFKLLMQELKTMNIQMHIITDDNVDNLMNLNADNVKELTGFDTMDQYSEELDRRLRDNSNDKDKYVVEKDMDEIEEKTDYGWILPDQVGEESGVIVGNVFTNNLDNQLIQALEKQKFEPTTPEGTPPDSMFGPTTPEGTPPDTAFGLMDDIQGIERPGTPDFDEEDEEDDDSDEEEETPFDENNERVVETNVVEKKNEDLSILMPEEDEEGGDENDDDDNKRI